MSPTAGFADIKAVLAALMRETAMEWSIEAVSSPLFLEGRGAKIIIAGKDAGCLGEVHPAALNILHINNPVAVMEINFSTAGL